MQGWIKLHRQIAETEFYFEERFTRLQAWVDLLLLANHKDAKVLIRGIEVFLQPGDLCYSQLTLAKRWQWNSKTVARFLKMLEKREMVDTKSGNVTTVISIRNWPLYQSSGDQNGYQNGEQKRSKTDTKRDTNKKGEKVKKEKNLSPVEIEAAKIYEHYAAKARSGARADAIRNIKRLLVGGVSPDVLRTSIDAYASNGMPSETQYRIQANNFFGKAERWKEYEAKSRGLSTLPSGPDPLAGISKAELTALAQAGKLTDEQKAEAIRRGL